MKLKASVNKKKTPQRAPKIRAVFIKKYSNPYLTVGLWLSALWGQTAINPPGRGVESYWRSLLHERKLPSTDLSTGTVWAFNSPEMILHIAKQSRTFGLIYESPNSSNILTAV
jgi:hypothetical protein